jgi:transcriptional regulator GlxA family with amidase domain
MPPHRLGGQAQFVQRDTLLGGTGSLAPTLRWLEANLERPITLADIARHARISQRSATRHFREQTGAAPLQWLLNARIEKAKELLAESDYSVEEIAHRCGFGSSSSFRSHFTRIAGVSPRFYRRSFGRPAAEVGPARVGGVGVAPGALRNRDRVDGRERAI